MDTCSDPSGARSTELTCAAPHHEDRLPRALTKLPCLVCLGTALTPASDGGGEICLAKCIHTSLRPPWPSYITEFPYGPFDYQLRLVQDECDDPVDLIVHTAGFDEDAKVFRIMDVWESYEQADRFVQERVRPLADQGVEALPDPDNAVPPTRETIYELHDVRVGSAMASARSTA